MSENFHHLKGAREVLRMMDELPIEIEKRTARAALRAGAVKLRDVVKPLIPFGRGTVWKKKPGSAAVHLRDTARASTSVRSGVVSAGMRVGNAKRGVFYAHMVDKGTKAHIVRAKKGRMLVIGGAGAQLIVRREVEHPGARGAKFMDRGIAAIPAALGTILETARVRVETWWKNQGRRA